MSAPRGNRTHFFAWTYKAMSALARLYEADRELWCAAAPSDTRLDELEEILNQHARNIRAVAGLNKIKRIRAIREGKAIPSTDPAQKMLAGNKRPSAPVSLPQAAVSKVLKGDRKVSMPLSVSTQAGSSQG